MESLPVLVAMVDGVEREEILNNLKHVDKKIIQDPLAKCLGKLGCALFGCANLKNMVDAENLKLKPFVCTVCNNDRGSSQGGC